MDEERPVYRCVCFDTPFTVLKEADVRSVEEAGRRFGCGTKCGLCRAYIQAMIDTGETAFAVFLE